MAEQQANLRSGLDENLLMTLCLIDSKNDVGMIIYKQNFALIAHGLHVSAIISCIEFVVHDLEENCYLQHV